MKQQRLVRLKAGMRVRVRGTAQSPIAGCEGIVTYVGETMCDVKVIKRRRGSKVEESIMDTLPRSELESVYPHVHLVSLDTAPTHLGWKRFTGWVFGVTAVLVGLWAVAHWVMGK